MMSPKHFPGAIPEARPWPGRGAVKGVSPGGAPFARPARLPARGRGLDTPKGRPGGVLWTLDGGVPASAYTLGRDGSGLRALSASRQWVSASCTSTRSCAILIWRGDDNGKRS